MLETTTLAHVWPVGLGASSGMGHLGSSQPIGDHQGLGAWVVKLVSGVGTSSPTIPKAWDLFLLPHSGKGELEDRLDQSQDPGWGL